MCKNSTTVIEGNANTDSFGFLVWNDSHRNSKWDDNKTYQELLFESKGEMLDPFEAIENGVRLNEVGYHYAYGGILSERGGIFIVKRDAPDKIIRAKQTWLS